MDSEGPILKVGPSSLWEISAESGSSSCDGLADTRRGSVKSWLRFSSRGMGRGPATPSPRTPTSDGWLSPRREQLFGPRRPRLESRSGFSKDEMSPRSDTAVLQRDRRRSGRQRSVRFLESGSFADRIERGASGEQPTLSNGRSRREGLPSPLSVRSDPECELLTTPRPKTSNSFRFRMSTSSLADVTRSRDRSSLRFSSTLCIPSTKIEVQKPLVEDCGFGERWALDVVALLHNAIRLEIRDLYDMLEEIASVLEEGRGLNSGLLKMLSVWWDRFEVGLKVVWEVVDIVVVGMLDAVMPTEGCVSRSERERVQERMRQGLSRVRALFTERPTSETVMADLVSEMDMLIRQVLSGFAEREQAVPPLLEVFYSESMRDDMLIQEREYICRSSKSAPTAMPLVARWLRTVHTPAYDEWLKLLPVTTRVALNVWSADMSLSHFKIPSKLSAACARLRRPADPPN
mmetsp:Transcript_11928/g.29174  ORF Transcript_11928/g.29174 Transcript_11928/m.29174 type:complete len:461 (-) Transcript_11928:111-1493(-)|eukprot:CAMPEP_0198333392 /NCGR_PEP_ID=MMETSP1450-20131203/18927_1 /TAXON_ID=753684 ORGANISM="Madagascaria erythrocladiodes, Strain CCMP3234" /NCGR_SAMPLE_ID=MMETSP1450 /ASSEMBLY_ACC=CAM_ASM_001115 /LENGTH=460 /DNA_ID=CAMNT_0044037903 /DNA_START=308 /DNA_END=1690 /DNA_ORIENTATION=+